VAATNIAGTLSSGQLPSGIVTNGASGVIVSGTFTGSGSGLTNVSAAQLTSIGNTTGSENFFVGPSGNATTTGFRNSANGIGALQSNTTGDWNTANGYEALQSNTGGINNTADGAWALLNNTGGSGNTADGAWALLFNTAGSDNTANGNSALESNTNGSENTANGFFALVSNTSGSYNTADGAFALLSNSTGTNNIALGYRAGQAITTGSDNIDIGNPGLSTDINIIRIGSDRYAHTFLAGSVSIGGDGTNLPAAPLQIGTVGNDYVGPPAGFYELLVADTVRGVDIAMDSTNASALVLQNHAGGDSTMFAILNGYLDTNVFTVTGNGTVTAAGTVTANGVQLTSDRNAKENFRPISTLAVLDKVVALPITEWNFKSEDETRHIGPMAQDFYGAFNVGQDNRHIAVVDEGGVALAAIQGLNEKVEGRSQKAESQIEELKAENAELKARLEKLERFIAERNSH
jgi:hypothetical protein